MSIAAADVSITRVALSIVHDAVSNRTDAMSITLRVWITICRTGMIDTSGWLRLREGESGQTETGRGGLGARECKVFGAEGEGGRE